MKREKFDDKVTPNYNKNTTVHSVYQYTSWPVNVDHKLCFKTLYCVGKTG